MKELKEVTHLHRRGQKRMAIILKNLVIIKKLQYLQENFLRICFQSSTRREGHGARVVAEVQKQIPE